MSLLLVWRHENGTTEVVDFVKRGRMRPLVKEIAAALDLVDGGKMFRAGIIADLERDNMVLRGRIHDMEKLDAYVLEKLAGPFAEAARA